MSQRVIGKAGVYDDCCRPNAIEAKSWFFANFRNVFVFKPDVQIT